MPTSVLSLRVRIIPSPLPFPSLPPKGAQTTTATLESFRFTSLPVRPSYTYTDGFLEEHGWHTCKKPKGGNNEIGVEIPEERV